MTILLRWLYCIAILKRVCKLSWIWMYDFSLSVCAHKFNWCRKVLEEAIHRGQCLGTSTLVGQLRLAEVLRCSGNFADTVFVVVGFNWLQIKKHFRTLCGAKKKTNLRKGSKKKRKQGKVNRKANLTHNTCHGVLIWENYVPSASPITSLSGNCDYASHWTNWTDELRQHQCLKSHTCVHILQRCAISAPTRQCCQTFTQEGGRSIHW